ncbi:MAG: FAD-dependent oxidoreductase, partial [Clostridia bacterium]|nr:FAD-dependent oxidoreductase [Clostridia bacterium]
MKTDVLIIGGGPAGIATAISASQTGATVTLVEREHRLGGILNQCIHNGFGLHYYGVELTGPEYARRLINTLNTCTNVTTMLNSSVINIKKNKRGKFVIQIASPEGLFNITAKSVVLTMGCRERP